MTGKVFIAWLLPENEFPQAAHACVHFQYGPVYMVAYQAGSESGLALGIIWTAGRTGVYVIQTSYLWLPPSLTPISARVFSENVACWGLLYKAPVSVPKDERHCSCLRLHHISALAGTLPGLCSGFTLHPGRDPHKHGDSTLHVIHL